MVSAGADVPGATASVRYLHDDDEDVRLLTELLVAELVAADLWKARTSGSTPVKSRAGLGRSWRSNAAGMRRVTS